VRKQKIKCKNNISALINWKTQIIFIKSVTGISYWLLHKMHNAPWLLVGQRSTFKGIVERGFVIISENNTVLEAYTVIILQSATCMYQYHFLTFNRFVYRNVWLMWMAIRRQDADTLFESRHLSKICKKKGDICKRMGNSPQCFHVKNMKLIMGEKNRLYWKNYKKYVLVSCHDLLSTCRYYSDTFENLNVAWYPT